MKLFDISEPSKKSNIVKDKLSIGIDLGTTNSLVAYSCNSIPNIIKENDQNIIPSIVSFLPNNTMSVGKLGLSKNIINIKSIKRLMGRTFKDHIEAEILNTNYIQNINDNIKIVINEKEYSPVQISAEILKKLKNIAENHFKQEVYGAVITVPAYFDDAARNATKEAAKLAGLKVMRLINEPTAAALAYNLDKKKEGAYLIYDLGGGTFDVSILKMQQGLFQVLATGGNTNLGGDDFDAKIAHYFIKKYNLPLNLINEFWVRLVEISCKAKEVLSKENTFESQININNIHLNFHLDKKTLELILQPEIKKTIDTAIEVLELSGLKKIDGIVLVGGSSRIPLIKQLLIEHFNTTIFTDLNPDEIVALGAAIQAEALTYGSENLLLDVTPLSLGLEVMGGIVEKIINRNTPIPISITEEFTTYKDGQNGMKFHIVQGERELVQNCRSLGYFEIEGIEPLKAGMPKIQVTFSIDTDGILTVTAINKSSNVSQQIVVNPYYGIEKLEIEKMLHDSILYAKEDMEMRLLQQAKADAERYIYEVEIDLIEEQEFLNHSYQEELKKQLQILKNIVEKNERSQIESEVKKLLKLGQELANNKIERYIGTAFKGKKITDLKNIIKS